MVDAIPAAMFAVAKRLGFGRGRKRQARDIAADLGLSQLTSQPPVVKPGMAGHENALYPLRASSEIERGRSGACGGVIYDLARIDIDHL